MEHMRALMKDKRGSTLIEIIVSVLIVGIVFVPLMMGLTSSLTANRRNENQLYAENVASNVVEICKTYGSQKMGEADITKFYTGASLQDVSGGAGTKFEINDITAGTGNEYHAVIEFKSDTVDSGHHPSYTYDSPGKQNDFSSYPTVSSVSNAWVLSFIDDDLKADIVEKFKASKKSTVTVDQLTDNISQWLSRKINIKIYRKGEAGSEKIYVSQDFEYFVNDTTGTYFESGSPNVIIHADETGPFENIASCIVLTYKPVKNTDLTPAVIKSDEIYITKDVPGNLNVYAIIENGSDMTDPVAFKPSVTVTHSSGIAVDINYSTSSSSGSGETSGSGESSTSGGSSTSGAGTPSSTRTYAVGAFSNLGSFVNLSCCDQLLGFGDGTGKASKMKDVKITVYEGKDETVSTTKVLEKVTTVIEFE